ncbi:hypothetical protein TBLA_0C02580 [Henningerozyma blattae CBS 6284]|uniref:Mediator of RNA polymerase II transcription subunit 18 n=1 Tax=Henningerozyma blattae (strain ATCC 34711 / CBS 6284 / DSM 70876 / NBRC 10599 / NRRL Y-10934 / UCD 77-7) TaxID=1071380 RepID=I2H115_HENB6|nr:hypothetical protein TBLA_0C02580 [Tetrapisispora blattae CBS 6284]CCH60067.1 hypothetical protein TBLA_0C02580 [Tetrapisispora blattae CBS 6284]
MVQQLSLYGTLPDDSYDLFISTMTMMSGSPPVLFANLANIWKPNPDYELEKMNSKNQLVEPNRMKLSKEIPLESFIHQKTESNDIKNYKFDYKTLRDLQEAEQLQIDLASLQNSKRFIDNKDTKQVINIDDKKDNDNADIVMTDAIDSEIIDIEKNDEEENNDPAAPTLNIQDDNADVLMTDLNPIVKIEETNNTSELDEKKNTSLSMKYPKNKSSCSWSLSVSDIPVAGNSRKVSMQSIDESVILGTSGNNSHLPIFLRELGYVPDYSFVTIGVHFFMKYELIIDVHKIWNLKEDNSTSQTTKGMYLIKAFVNVTRSTDIDRINHAEKALLALQRELQGYVELFVPDRKSMDSRVHDNTDRTQSATT